MERYRSGLTVGCAEYVDLRYVNTETDFSTRQLVPKTEHPMRENWFICFGDAG